MAEWEKSRPGSFYKKYDERNLVEGSLSSFKCMFGRWIRAVIPRMQVF